MADYALEGAKWGSAVAGTSGGTVTWAASASLPASFLGPITAAFADWSRYANIGFTQASSPVGANITFGLAAIDGTNKVVGSTSYSYRAGVLSSAAVTFDTAEGWHASGSTIVSDSGVKLFLVALHEIGHAIGVDHYSATQAVMNPTLTAAVGDLTQSDIHAIQALYGAVASAQSPVTASAAPSFGSFAHDISSAGGTVFALFHGLLGRAPDPLGLERYASAMSHGAAAREVADALLASSERTSVYGALAQSSDASFIQQLYQSVLGRSVDAGGLAYYGQILAGGGVRADVAVSIALSPEHAGQLAGPLAAGVYVPNEDAANAARLYYGVLGRSPDPSGLAATTGNIAGGATLRDTAAGFLGSSEYASKFGSPGDAAFIDTVYRGALGRGADPAGLSYFADALQHGASRADVAVAISESPEAQRHLLPVIESTWLLG